MLKLFNYLSKSNTKTLCHRISTSATSRKSNELVKKRDDDYSIKEISKKPARPPLVKNFCVGIVDTELIAFPEAIYENDYLAKVVEYRQEYARLMDEHVFSNPDDKKNIEKMKDFNSFGTTPLLTTEELFRMTEVENKHLSYSTFLNNHRLVMKLLNEFGTEAQKMKYTQKLENGDLIGFPAVFEMERSTEKVKFFKTEATFKESIEKWVLNGEKAFSLISPVNFDKTLFLVLASTVSEDRKGDLSDIFTVFIVDGSQPGVTVSRVDKSIGLKEDAFNQVRVSFKGVELDESQILSKDNPMKFLHHLVMQSRLTQGSMALNGIMKPIINELTKHSINTVVQGLHMKDVDVVKEQLGSLSAKFYTLESMIYVTAGLIDIYDKQDIEVESAMVQSYAIQAMNDFVMRPIQAVGSSAVCEGSPFDRLIRDAMQFAANGEHLDATRQSISLSSLAYAGTHLEETVNKVRNPLYHPNFIFARMLTEKSIQSPKRKVHIQHYLHPSLEEAGNMLEDSIMRLAAAVDILLARHGSLVVEHTVEVAKIADAATLCYAMFAICSRASRSYCIGLRNADSEVNMVNVICFYYSREVLRLALEIDTSEHGTSEAIFKGIGEKLIERKGYPFEHPTTRNF